MSRFTVWSLGKQIAEADTREAALRWAKISRDAGNDTTVYDSRQVGVRNKGKPVEFLRAKGSK